MPRTVDFCHPHVPLLRVPSVHVPPHPLVPLTPPPPTHPSPPSTHPPTRGTRGAGGSGCKGSGVQAGTGGLETHTNACCPPPPNPNADPHQPGREYFIFLSLSPGNVGDNGNSDRRRRPIFHARWDGGARVPPETAILITAPRHRPNEPPNIEGGPPRAVGAPGTSQRVEGCGGGHRQPPPPPPPTHLIPH